MRGHQTQKRNSFSGFKMLLILISYSCQLFCCGGGARGRAFFISVTTSGRFPNDQKLWEQMWPHQIPWLYFCLEILICISLMTPAWAPVVGTASFGEARTWHHLESISSSFFCFWSSCKRLRCAAISSSQCPVSSRQAGCLCGCCLMWQQWWGWGNKSSNSLSAEMREMRITRRFLLLSWLCFPVLHSLEPLLCAQPPRESCEE